MALAAAVYRVVVPDQRGYRQTEGRVAPGTEPSPPGWDRPVGVDSEGWFGTPETP